MNGWQGALLGLVQGATEFFPVSSSGHLVLTRKLLGLDYPMSFDIMLHGATLLAVLVVLRRDILDILRKPFARLTGMILIACIPAFLMGYFLEDLVDSVFRSGRTLGAGFFVTGAALLLGEWVLKRNRQTRDLHNMKARDAILVGAAQGVAILPAISRSGMTIVGGMLTGLDRTSAIRFSFLLSIPVIAGAALYDLLKVISTGEGLGAPLFPLLAGLATAAVSGYLAARFMLKVFARVSLRGFAWYVFCLGVLSTVLLLTGVIA